MDARFVLLIPIALGAGVITAISPCVFPVLPILFAGGGSGSKRKPYAIIAGLVTSFATFTLVATWLLEKLGLPPSDPVSKKNLPEFAALREKWLPVLKNPEIFQANAVSSGPSQGH